MGRSRSGRVVAVRPELVQALGPDAAILLSQALHWQRVVGEGNPWWKTREEWEEETGLGRHRQLTARKRLKRAGLIRETSRAGKKGATCYLVDLDALRRQRFVSIDGRHPDTSTAGIRTSRRPGSGHHDGRDAAVVPSFIDDTPEDTREETGSFHEVWESYVHGGGVRPGPRRAALSAWRSLVAATGWSYEEAIGRWRRWIRASDPRYWPALTRILDPAEERLTDDSLRAVEARRRITAGDSSAVDDAPRITPAQREQLRRARAAEQRRERSA